MSLEPPPRIVDKFVNIWRDWLYFFWEFVDSHTGGSTPTPPATGTSWNAHGNIATGDVNVADTNLNASGDQAVLQIDAGTLFASGTTGNTPDMDQAGTYMAYIPGKDGAFRSGISTVLVPDAFSDANIGRASVAFGQNNIADNFGCFAVGDSNVAANGTGIAMGQKNEARGHVSFSGNSNIAMGASCKTAGFLSCVSMGSQCEAYGVATIALGVGSIAGSSGAFDVTASAYAIGDTAKALTNNTVSIGIQVTSDANQSVAVGILTEVSAAGSFVIGIGDTTGATNRLVNNIPNTMMLGCGSDIPTITMRNDTPGSGTIGKIGIVFTDPLSTLDVGGSVGYKQDIITATNGAGAQFTIPAFQASATGSDGNLNWFAGTFTGKGLNVGDDIFISGAWNGGLWRIKTIATNTLTIEETFPNGGTNSAVMNFHQPVNQSLLTDQLAVLIDPDLAVGVGPSGSPEYIVKLPDISTVDRRMYHVRHNGVSGSSLIAIRPDVSVSDTIDLSPSGSYGTGTSLQIGRGDALQLVANLTDKTWWVI